MLFRFVSPRAAGWLATALTAAGLALAAWIGPLFALSALVYVGLSHFYSLAGKNVVILDVMLIAAGFVVRAIAKPRGKSPDWPAQFPAHQPDNDAGVESATHEGSEWDVADQTHSNGGLQQVPEAFFVISV